MTIPLSIAVFGGSGFLGRALVQALVQQGHRVRVPSRQKNQQTPWSMMGMPDQVCPFYCQPRQDASVAAALDGMDAAVNLIGILHEKGPASFQATHVETAARIARLAKEKGVRHFLHVSALGASLQAKARYARSKAVGEEAVRAFFPEAVIFRPSLMFGPEDAFLTRFANMARFLPFLPLIGGGTTLFQPLFVGDAAAAGARVLFDRKAQGRTYLLGGPQIFSFRALLEHVMRAMGKTPRFINLPWDVAALLALVGERLPSAPLTRDHLRLLRQDNIVPAADADPIGTNSQSGHWTLADTGVTPRLLDLALPDMICCALDASYP